jgi:hypothetical protein
MSYSGERIHPVLFLKRKGGNSYEPTLKKISGFALWYIEKSMHEWD